MCWVFEGTRAVSLLPDNPDNLQTNSATGPARGDTPRKQATLGTLAICVIGLRILQDDTPNSGDFVRAYQDKGRSRVKANGATEEV